MRTLQPQQTYPLKLEYSTQSNYRKVLISQLILKNDFFYLTAKTLKINLSPLLEKPTRTWDEK